MKKKTYYGLLEEYQELVSQKQYNEHFCNRDRLEEVKALLCKELYSHGERELRDVSDWRGRYYYCNAVERRWLAERVARKLDALYEKISNDKPLEKKDFENTFYEPRIICGLTLPQLLLAFLIAIALTVVIKLFS